MFDSQSKHCTFRHHHNIKFVSQVVAYKVGSRILSSKADAIRGTPLILAKSFVALAITLLHFYFLLIATEFGERNTCVTQ